MWEDFHFRQIYLNILRENFNWNFWYYSNVLFMTLRGKIKLSLVPYRMIWIWCCLNRNVDLFLGWFFKLNGNATITLNRPFLIDYKYSWADFKITYNKDKQTSFSVRCEITELVANEQNSLKIASKIESKLLQISI